MGLVLGLLPICERQNKRLNAPSLFCAQEPNQGQGRDSRVSPTAIYRVGRDLIVLEDLPQLGAVISFLLVCSLIPCGGKLECNSDVLLGVFCCFFVQNHIAVILY